MTIGLELEIMEVDAAHKVTRSNDIMRLTLGSATMSQMNGRRELERPLYNNPTLLPDQRNEWEAGCTEEKIHMLTASDMYKEAVMIGSDPRDEYNAMDVVQKTGVETMALGVVRRCIGLIAIRKPDHGIHEPRPTSRQGCSEMQEAVTNVTTKNIFMRKDIGDETERTCNNFDVTNTPMHQQAQTKGGENTRNVKNQRLITEEEHQQWLEDNADSGPSYVVKVLMDNV